MFFSKNNETIESLMNECQKGHEDFLFSFSKAHHKSYFAFKMKLKANLYELYDLISVSKDEKVMMALLRHMKQQYEFINKNPFSADKIDMMEFYAKNYPYEEKILEIMKNPSINEPTIKNKATSKIN